MYWDFGLAIRIETNLLDGENTLKKPVLISRMSSGNVPVLVRPSMTMALVGRCMKLRTLPQSLSSRTDKMARRCVLSVGMPLRPHTNWKRSKQSVQWSIGMTKAAPIVDVHQGGQRTTNANAAASKHLGVAQRNELLMLHGTDTGECLNV